MIKRSQDVSRAARAELHRRRRAMVAVLPTLFTLGNLVCGFFAIVVASRVDAPLKAVVVGQAEPVVVAPVEYDLDERTDWRNCMLSGWLILLAMVFDALDGHVARLSRMTSEFGKELDSLCDVVTFGVAPAFLLVKIVPDFAVLHREAVWMIAATFAACAALRLARFNVESGDSDDHLYFRGLPSPAAAASIASFAIMFYTLRRNPTGLSYLPGLDMALQAVLPFFSLCVALLMVSRIPYPHVVHQILSGRRSFGHMVQLLFALVLVMMLKGYSLPLVTVVFVTAPPIRWLVKEWQRRRFLQRSPF
ncbi:MAG: CDP-diacylglycerol--serine O-phosphatidyltransferase [Pirellulales bacterium]|nr:CDP-diacylglycerol--serine O-phosphatidyltransferase [Pirellulales bacterium]